MAARPRALLDTDTISALMKGDPTVARQARAYLLEHDQLTLSIISRYEILRGFKAKRALRQLEAFDQFCATSIVLPPTDEVVVRAAEI